jgi:hypothetical protein
MREADADSSQEALKSAEHIHMIIDYDTSSSYVARCFTILPCLVRRESPYEAASSSFESSPSHDEDRSLARKRTPPHKA